MKEDANDEDPDVVGTEKIDLPHSEDRQKFDFPAFNKLTDMDDPIFKLGMVFSNPAELRCALSMYIVKNRVKIKKTRNNSTRIEAKCVEGCPWRMIALKDSRVECMLIKTYVGEHTCERVWEVKELTGPLLAGKFVEDFRDDPKMNLTAFQNKVQKKYNMKPNKFKLARARLYCLKKIRGDEEAQYGQLRDYGHELRIANPGTTFYLKRMGETLSTLYLCLDACKRGWLLSCRPIICLDGTHIRTKYGGQILTAIGVDPNDCIYPIALVVVEVECHASWKWFLTTLKTDLNIINTSTITIMSDKQKVCSK